MTHWKILDDHALAVKDRRILSLFDDKTRFANFSVAQSDLLMDFSKTNIDADTLSALVALLKSTNVEQRRDAMFAGERINETEDRSVLHTALRLPDDAALVVEGIDVVPEVVATRNRMKDFATKLRNGFIATANGQKFTDIVNIGIGGSDLGPVMACLALAPYHDGPKTHFVSNVDGAHVTDVLAGLNPETTLLIVASKTFTTIETMTNAKTAQDWLVAKLGKAGADLHLAALSTAEDKAQAFGVQADRIFGFEDWVGGRYSLWGPIGMSILLAIGPDDFDAFLAGAYEMDQHFQSAPLEQNLPALMAMVGIWHANACGYDSRAVLPYDQRLTRLPAYLQQLDMESNGKSVAMDGARLPRNSGPIVWGEPGTNGQHAFYQLIHQGTRVIPCEFLVARKGHETDLAHQHDLLLANCLAQTEALMLGRDLDVAKDLMDKKGLTGAERDRQAAHRVFEGNRPSTTLMYDTLNPHTLGRLIALYEHRVFVEGVVWGLNSFDQWGVELGKVLAVELLPMIQGADASSKDGSTQGLLRSLKK